jgi:hypothetical protein
LFQRQCQGVQLVGDECGFDRIVGRLAALAVGRGGLPGGSSLYQLLAEERGVVNHTPLLEEDILAWADAHHSRTGRWPAANSGRVVDAPGECWVNVENSLSSGWRGLPGGSSLARFLVERRGSRSPMHLPPLSIRQILAWADAYHARTGEWPTRWSGPVPEAPGETWSNIHFSLVCGTRGLSAGWSLIRLFAKYRRVHSKAHRPQLTIPDILRWADSYHDRHGKWPNCRSGAIREAKGETWYAVQRALGSGLRGLPGGSTLPRLLREQRGATHCAAKARLSVEGILAWADAYHLRTGNWPHGHSGPIPESPSNTWAAVESALRSGGRGL